MPNLTNLEIGSVVVTLIENVPAGVSGLIPTLVNNNVFTAELITGISIPIDSIGEPYQPGITNLTIGNVLGLMAAQGIGTDSVKLGELSLSKGMNMNSAQEWKQLGIDQLNEIGPKMSYYQSWSSNA